MLTTGIGGGPFYREVALSNYIWDLMGDWQLAVEQICPPLSVPKSSGLFWKHDPAYTMRDTEGQLELDSEPQTSAWRYAMHRYECFLNYVACEVTWKDNANTDGMINVEGDRLEQIANVLSIGWEKQFRNVALSKEFWTGRGDTGAYRIGQSKKHMFVDFNPGEVVADWATNPSAAFANTDDNSAMGGRRRQFFGGIPADMTAYWDSLNINAQQNPVVDIQKGMAICENEAGKTPNCLVMNTTTYRRMATNPALRNLYRFNAPGLVPPQTLAGWIGIENIIFSNIIENVAVDEEDFDGTMVFGREAGSATADKTAQAGLKTADAVLLYKPRTDGPKVASAIKCFAWTSYFRDASMNQPSMSDTIGVRIIPRPVKDKNDIRGYRPTAVEGISNLLGFAFFNVMSPFG